MPLQWVPPEVFLEHKGVTIYHVYKDDDMENGAMEYWYGTSEAATDCGDDGHSFDVRDLETWKMSKVKDEARRIRKSIIEAINLGILKDTTE